MIPPPQQLAPPAPFPLVLTQAVTTAFVAPGVLRAEYRLTTSAGPLIVHVIELDAAEPTLRLGVVTAHDRLVSAGETVSAMARRTGAVAGVNADYFDIGQTNQPLNVVVAGGTLVRTPSKRAAMLVGPRNAVRFGSVSFAGSAGWPGASVPLTTVNEFPPQGGAGLVTPAFGTLTAAPGVTVAALEPEPGTSPGAPGTYRVTAVGPAAKGPVRTPLLALGPAALKIAVPPNVGDDVALRFDLTPGIESIREAVGGGPMLVADGAAIDDPNAPAPEERDVRFPLSGAGVTADGTVLLVAVDGRQAAASVGLTRPEFAALFQGLRATGAIAFDSGGSATLVGRVLGDADASVLNAPSDGGERPVADALLAYSDAPVGLAQTLVARPATVAALPGVAIPIQITAVDAAGHPVLATTHALVTASVAPGAHVERLVRGSLALAYPYRTVGRVASLHVLPALPNPEPRGTVTLAVSGADEHGQPILLGDASWTVDRGVVRIIDGHAIYTAGARDGVVTVAAGGAVARVVVRVGHRTEPLTLFAPGGVAWQFATAPGKLPGSVTLGVGAVPELALAYDFGAGERAAYARTRTSLPGTPLGFGVRVTGAEGLLLRGLFENNLGEKRAFTLVPSARVVSGVGSTAVGVDFPDDLYPPVTLLALYVAPAASGRSAAGIVRFSEPFVSLPGTP